MKNQEMNTVEVEALFAAHIARLKTLVAGRDKDNPMDQDRSKTDLKNIASLREGRVPQYGDHITCLLGDDEYPMSEFRDIVEEQRLTIP